MITELSGRRLVDVKVQGDRQTLSIHRLLQEKILRDLERDKFTEVFGKAYCLVRKQFPPASPIQVPEPSKWPACKEYTPHVLSLRRAFKATTAIKPSFDLAQLFYDAGFHVWERQTTPDEGVLYLEAAEEILNRLKYNPNAKIRADIHTIMALLYSIIGISFRAQNLQRCRDALAIRQKVHELHPEDSNNDVLFTNAASDLGYCLFDTWGYEEADKIYQSCYQKYCVWGIENELPFEYSKHYENNGRVNMYRGNYSEAISLFRRGLELSEKALGKTWRYWALQSHIACTMLQSGDLQSALEMHLEVSSAQEKALGKYDSVTIMSNYAVGAVYYHLGNLSAAA
jgi:tetratricopeptide (TPR) repeat protein